MSLIVGKVTKDARVFWPQMFGGLQAFKLIDTFKVGEGGWIDPGSGAVPRTPVDDLRNGITGLQDLDCLVDSTRAPAMQRYATDERASFTKSLTLADFSFESPSILRVKIFLDFGEFNDDGFGNAPEIWEVGVFSDHPQAGISLSVGTKLMVGYATFSKETKDSSKQLENEARFIF